MDIDRISYIFGSFARRRQSNENGGSIKRRSIESGSRVSHERSRSSPIHTKKPVASPRAKSVIGSTLDEPKFKCPLCKSQFVEPRVLPCLHTFCLKCLTDLEQNHFAAWNDDDSDGVKSSSSHSRKTSSGGSGGSGYVSDKHDERPIRGICCPSCGTRIEVPYGGVRYFPPNYCIQHQMVLALLNSKNTHLLCDLCTSDVTATSRCMECAISFCVQCEEYHLRQKFSSDHEVLSLEDAREKGISKVRRQIMCMIHPDSELVLFCSTCYQAICQECVSVAHRSHICEPVSKVAKSHIISLRMAADKAKALVEQSAMDTSVLSTTSKRIELDYCKIQTEVEKFIEEYIKSIEEHKSNLLEQIRQIRDEKMQQIIQEKLRLQKKIRDARDIAYFLDDLLRGGSDVEVLSFIKPVINKIEACDNLEPSPELKYSDSIQFLPDEAVKDTKNPFNIYGVLTTQSVSAEHCKINPKDLQNLRVGKKVTVTLETRDSKENPLERGGEYVTAEIRHRDAGVSRSLMVNVVDKRDGTYGISFVPDIAGKLAFIIKVKGEHIQGSPFPILVRSLKPHYGTFHCCSFCSSGGSKEASCGCDGKMPGGYKGCGHGHEGHPGRRHWSCCGNILEHSECGRSRSNSQYQFTL
ncbi:tripartite motif-containing protein 45 [Anthonomus grandis grandis]|uniref:tripartite motif-containing protein 45 n=1 Tax=Anthonomus grandis grandis TaxID=2921223 RepID=UPI002166227A|nr:tripartite motif-containing protein 45 [Anthonomus grandis grandis]XP_050309636.1 tripartite motif-containing protein 45 [Anthonomus grandis grandis]